MELLGAIGSSQRARSAVKLQFTERGAALSGNSNQGRLKRLKGSGLRRTSWAAPKTTSRYLRGLVFSSLLCFPLLADTSITYSTTPPEMQAGTPPSSYALTDIESIRSLYRVSSGPYSASESRRAWRCRVYAGARYSAEMANPHPYK